MPSPHGGSLTNCEQVVVASRNSSSPGKPPYETPEFRLKWDNAIAFHVAEHVNHLRRYRGLSQEAVAARMGTSQPAVARIESGEENIKIATLARLCDALDGRFYISISPAEINLPRISPWWEWIGAGVAPTNPLSFRGFAVKQYKVEDIASLVSGWTGESYVQDSLSLFPPQSTGTPGGL